ncbi:MAG: hypothetical protein LBC27_05100 [Spirochaetaceae bacterium]|jgi:hypothetical protein|nr:hypothetical protein [Spirochaetaceae bacterium]
MKFTQKLSKKGQKASVFVLVLGFTALVFSACENDFMKKAFDTIAGPVPVIPAPIEWNTNVVYVDPLSGTLAGTLYAVLNNGGRRIWFAKDQTNQPAAKRWEFKVNTPPPDGGALITAGSLITFLRPSNVPLVTDGDLMELNLYSEDLDQDFISQADSPDGVSCSFILYPEALYGADRDTVSIETATLNFKVERPSVTVYAKYVIEKAEYGSISVTWAEGSASAALKDPPPDDFEGAVKNEMMNLAGSLAAGSAGFVGGAWANTWESDFTFGDAGSLSAVAWISPPSQLMAKGWAPYKKYAIELSPFFYASDGAASAVSPQISAPVEFVSDVGLAAILISAAAEAGSFSGVDAAAVGGTVSQLTSGLIADPGAVVNWSGGAAPTDAGTYTFSVVLGSGSDTSPGDTVEGLTAIIIGSDAPPEE